MEEGQDQQSNSTNVSDSRNVYGGEDLIRSEVPTAELGHINPTTLEHEPPGSRQLPTSPLPQTIGKLNVNVTKPRRFGFDSNSLVNCVQDGATITMKSKESGSVSIRSKSNFNSSFCKPNPGNKRRYSTANSGINNELSQPIPKRPRCKDVDAGIGGNCKKTSCLKQVNYCTKSCVCDGCFNRPNKDTIEDTTQQFGSSNPLTSASEIIQHATEGSKKRSMENGILSSSATRKTRCSCKKSMCLKGGCSCHRANVGCSAGCRCDGCQNVFGQREEYLKGKHQNAQDISGLCDVSSGGYMQESASTNEYVNKKHPSRQDISELYDVSSSGNLHKVDFTDEYYENQLTAQDIRKLCDSLYDDRYMREVASTDEYVKEKNLNAQGISELYDISSGGYIQEVASRDGTLYTLQFSPELTPQTPSFQYSNHGKDRSKSTFPSRRYLTSPECADVEDSDIISPGPSGNISNHGIVQDVNKDISELIPFHQEFDDVFFYTADDFSPIYATVSFDESLSFSAVDFACGLSEALKDDPPDILKDNFTPSNSGKVNSPFKKLVSPSHATVQVTLHATVPSCKHALKYVPSFSPLTPSIDPKDKKQQPGNS